MRVRKEGKRGTGRIKWKMLRKNCEARRREEWGKVTYKIIMGKKREKKIRINTEIK